MCVWIRMYSLCEVFSHLFSGTTKHGFADHFSPILHMARPLSQGEQPDPSEAPHQADASGESVQSPKLRQCWRKKSLETNATWIVLHVKIIYRDADQRTKWFISGSKRSKLVLNLCNISIQNKHVHMRTFNIKPTTETNIYGTSFKILHVT